MSAEAKSLVAGKATIGEHEDQLGLTETEEPPNQPRRTSRLWWLTAIVAVSIGAAGQIRVWAFDRGLWHDELYVAVNLVKHTYLGMGGGLYWNQTAPPGWLIGERAIYQLLGGDEQLLRLPQLLASLALLVLVVVIGIRAVGRWGALLAVVLAGVNPMLLYYAGELKQYAVEAMMALVLLLAAEAFGSRLRQGGSRTRDAVIFAAIAVLTMGGSYSALIVLGGLVAGLLVMLAADRLWRAGAIVIAAAAPGFLVGAFQVLLRRRFGFLGDQDAYFADGLPPLKAGPAEILQWVPHMWDAFVRTPISWRFSVFVLAMAIAGLVSMWMTGKRLWAVLFIGVFVASLGAAIVRGLPMAERVSLYLVAPLVILVVAGIDGLIRAALLSFRARRVGAVKIATVVGALLAVAGSAVAVQPAIAASYRQVSQPAIVAPYQPNEGDRELDNGRALLREVKARMQPGDVVLAYWYTEPLVLWYGQQYDIPVAGYASTAAAGSCEPDGMDRVLAGAKRVWYVHLELLSFHPQDLHAHVISALTQRGQVVDSHVYGPGTILEQSPSWTLVDLSVRPEPDSFPKPAPLEAQFGCLTVDPIWK